MRPFDVVRFEAEIGSDRFAFDAERADVVALGDSPQTLARTLAAGGLRPFANKRNVQVTRGAKDGTFVKTTVDLVEIGEEGKAYKDMKLKAGDVVYVRETYW